ncbi:Plant intracellular Ras-group-related LRR protein 7 [Sesamum angolense]|uniref:Plant intracellular Ras-group-related LRR protein 7 n=1 Tax=Sesamum angolense TaxID=2727404 RepID=A0AAE2BSF9_9LAMI|nr:Plant intracellular Ras-group-related LRR protein 7 [Sesamum angolense]
MALRDESLNDLPPPSHRKSFTDVIKEIGVNVFRNQSYRAKWKALARIEGSSTDQYGKLRDYAKELRSSNPGSTVILKTTTNNDDERPIFGNSYVCFKRLKEGYLAGCIPIIGVDSCHLKGPHRGMLLTAVYQHCIYSVNGPEKRKQTGGVPLLPPNLGRGKFATNSVTTTSSQGGLSNQVESVGIEKQPTFPDEILDLEGSVRTLDLTRNKLVDIPMEISKLINLQRLVLADNLIGRLPMNLGKLQSLKVMTLDGNRVTTLPDELGQLVKLERLSISGNLLVNLPETIGSLRNLMLLNVSNNKIRSLPESIGSCYSLEEIQADENSIEELPSSVCNLVHLKSLCLNNNNVKQIPPNLLKDCKSLQNISLHGNPISLDYFQQMEGFEDFESRRKRKFDKQIDSNVMISSKGLDEGVDH